MMTCGECAECAVFKEQVQLAPMVWLRDAAKRNLLRHMDATGHGGLQNLRPFADVT